MQIELSPEERNLLVRLVEGAIADSRVEIRRTTTPDFHDRLLHEEHRLENLLGRLRPPAGG